MQCVTACFASHGSYLNIFSLSVLKTVRATRPVLSHDRESAQFHAYLSDYPPLSAPEDRSWLQFGCTPLTVPLRGDLTCPRAIKNAGENANGAFLAANLNVTVGYWEGEMREHRLILAGPIPIEPGTFGILVLRAKDVREAEELVKHDPSVVAHVTDYEIYPLTLSLYEGSMQGQPPCDNGTELL